MSEEWGPYTEHDGSPCPIVGKYARVFCANGEVFEKIAGSWQGDPAGIKVNCWDWSCRNLQLIAWDQRVVGYRVRKPRALQQLREIAENLPERVDA